MRSYELVCAFRVTEGQDVAGTEAVKRILTESGAAIKSEDDMGDYELAYSIQKESRGRYRLFNIDVEQKLLPKINSALKLQTEILRYLFVLKDR